MKWVAAWLDAPSYEEANLMMRTHTFDRAGEVHVPVTIAWGSADRLVNPEGSRIVAERAGSTDLELHVYDGLYHEIFNEPEQDGVLGDLADWLRKRL